MFNLKSGEPCGCVGKSIGFQSCTSYFKSVKLKMAFNVLDPNETGKQKLEPSAVVIHSKSG